MPTTEDQQDFNVLSLTWFTFNTIPLPHVHSTPLHVSFIQYRYVSFTPPMYNMYNKTFLVLCLGHQK